MAEAAAVVVRLLLACCVATGAWAFNLDLRHPMIFSGGSSGIDFGYSVSLHVNQGRASVLAGAPKANAGAGAGLNQTGAVYLCPVGFGQTCQQLDLDSTANNAGEEKSYMRLGSSVMSSGVGGVAVACAPFLHNTYPWNYSRPNNHYNGVDWSDLWDPVGRCHIIPSNLQPALSQNFQPCVSYIHTVRSFLTGGNLGLNPTVTELDFCLTGSNIDITPTFRNSASAQSLFLSAPGYHQFTGRMFMTEINARSGSMNTPISSASTRTLPAFIHLNSKGNADSNETYFRRNQYLGMSSTQGDFNGDGQHEVAIAKPEGNSSYVGAPWMSRAVIFITPSVNDQFLRLSSTFLLDFLLSHPVGEQLLAVLATESYIRILGQQIHEFFGKVAIAYDTNNDGQDELIVGAPMFSLGLDDSSTTDRNGRVYIYSTKLSQATTQAFSGAGGAVEIATPDRILMTGPAGSQFGTAISRLGDINHDGYNDVAIGAPFEDSLQGAVYVFHGSPSGLLRTERVTPALIGQPSMRGFGWSISPGMDADGNTFNDLLVGAPLSNNAALIRARATLLLSASMSFSLGGGFTPCAPGQPVTSCFIAQVCFTTTSDVQLSSTVAVHYTLGGAANIFFQPVLTPGSANMSAKQEAAVVTITRVNETACANHSIYLRAALRNPCAASSITFRWTSETVLSTQAMLPHIFVENTPQPIVLPVDFVRDCPACYPDLAISNPAARGGISGVQSDTILAGVGYNTLLTFVLANKGIVLACRPELRLELPSTITAITRSTAQVSCLISSSTAGISTHVCTLLRTLHPGMQINVSFWLDGSNLDITPSQHRISLSVSSNNTNPEPASTMADNSHQMMLTVRSQASLMTVGTAAPPLVNITTTSGDFMTSRVVHRHAVLNQGPSNAPTSVVQITVDLSLKDGYQYATLDNVLSTSNSTRCNYTDGVESEVPSQAPNATLLYQVSRPGWQPQAFGSLSQQCVGRCMMVCDVMALASGLSTTLVLSFTLKTGALRTSGRLGNGTDFRSFSQVLSVGSVPGFTWDRNGSLQAGSARTRLVVVPGGKDSGIPWLAIWLPIVCVLLLIILIIIVLKTQGFFDRGKHLEKLMLKSTQAVLGAAQISTDGIYRKSVSVDATENGGNKRMNRPSLSRQESSI